MNILNLKELKLTRDQMKSYKGGEEQLPDNCYYKCKNGQEGYGPNCTTAPVIGCSYSGGFVLCVGCPG